MGFLYICLHLQAARKGDPINRARPSFQHPLHSSAIVVARIDMISWVVSLLAVSVAVSKNPAPISRVNLVACAFVTPALTFILCVVEKATRPFDLPYLTPPTSRPSSLVTCRVSGLIANIMSTEVTSEDSISRRASAASFPPLSKSASSSSSSTTSTSHSSRHARPNSHTQHAAAIAASTVGTTVTAGGAGGLGGPRPPPASVKEARPWSFTKFDDRTKRQLAASVSEASHSSDTRPRVGGPRPLAASDIAVKTGVLPPPVCTEPKTVEMPQREREREGGRERQTSQELVVRPSGSVRSSSSSAGAAGAGAGAGVGGGWKGEWSALRNITGWCSPANSSATTPVSTPGLEHGPGGGQQQQQQQQPRNRPLSTVAEDPAKTHHRGGRKEITYRPTDAATSSGPAPPGVGWDASTASSSAVVPAPTARRARTISHGPSPPSYTTTTAADTTTTINNTTPSSSSSSSTSLSSTNRPRCLTGPRGPEQQLVGGGYYSFDSSSAGIPRLPPPAATAPAPAAAPVAAAPAPSPTRAPTTARVRLQRAQDALKTNGRTMSGTVVLNRPQRLTGDRRGSADDRMAMVAAPVRGGGREPRW